MRCEIPEVSLHYTVDGNGPDLILLHGNGEDLSIFSQAIKVLKLKYTVYAIDLRNHGSSSQTEIYDYTVMAHDIKEFCRALSLQRPCIFGFSDGAIIALICEINYPNTFKQLILAGINMKPSDLLPDVYQEMSEEFHSLGQLGIKLMLEGPMITKEQCQSIECRVDLLIGQFDVISTQQAIDYQGWFQCGHLSLFKGRNHYNYIVNTSEFVNLVDKVIR